jgi:hypothetical protein
MRIIGKRLSGCKTIIYSKYQYAAAIRLFVSNASHYRYPLLPGHEQFAKPCSCFEHAPRSRTHAAQNKIILRNRCRETRAQRFSLRDIRKDPERKVIMAEMRFDQEVMDFPHCPTCHASLVNPINHMVTPTYCDFCWHLSIRDALLRFLAYLGLAWLVSQQVIQFFSWL